MHQVLLIHYFIILIWFPLLINVTKITLWLKEGVQNPKTSPSFFIVQIYTLIPPNLNSSNLVKLYSDYI